MPPQSRGQRQVRRGLGPHSKSSPNLSNKPEQIPPVPEPPAKSALSKPQTQSPRRTPKESPLNNVQSRGSPTPNLSTSSTAKASPPDSNELSIEEQDFAAIQRGRSISSTSGSDDSEAEAEQNQDNDHITSNSTNRLPPLITSLPRPPRPFYSTSSRSHSSLGLPQHEHSRPHSTHALAPPFYNRPPTPLPPSPSLTSLLRPLSFSALPSRQTTPDSSDTEAPSVVGAAAATRSSTAAVVGHAARTATTVPRASPKVPTYEYYGFVLHLGSSLAFIMYILWSYLPTPFLHQMGIYYYPDRWWSLAIPAWLVMVIVYIFVALAGYNTGYMTLGMSDLGCLVDEKGQIAVVDETGRIIRKGRGNGGGGVQQAEKKDGTKSSNHKAVQNEQRKAGKEASRPAQHKLTSVQVKPQQQELNWKTLWNEGTDAVMDVPLGGVCEILYGEDRDTGAEEDGDEVYD